MKKRYIGFLLTLCMLLTLCAPALAAEAEPVLEAPEAPAFIAGEETIEEEPLAPAEPAEDMPAEADAAQAEPMEEADEPMTVSSGSCGTDLTYSLSGSTLTISGTGAMSNYSLYSGRLPPWYGERNQIRSVIVSGGVTSIGEEAFYACENMTSVSLPSGLTSIGLSAFRDCSSLRTVTIPDSVRTMGYAVFSRCTNLTSATLSSGMANIPQHTFSDCTSLQSVTIPSSITSINTNAFYNCSSLRNITIPSRVATIYPSAFQACTSLTSVTIPASVTQIGALAFADCTGLTSVTFAGRSTKLESQVFANTPWMKAQGNFVVQDGLLMYYQGPGGSVSIPGNVISIDDHVFTGRTDITAVTIPGSVRTIGNWAFAETGLKSVTIPSGVTTIGNDAFAGCVDLASVTIPGSVTQIGDEAFWACQGLTSVTIPEGVRTIGDRAFMECTAMHTVTLPSTVADIGLETFRNSVKLRKIVINGANFSFETNSSGSAHNAYAEFLSPALIVYGNGRGNARTYAASMGLTYADVSQQHRSGWVSEGGYTCCYEDGKRAADEWKSVSGVWKRLDSQGHMLTGLQEILAGGYDDGLYYFDSQGAMKVGWQRISGSWYYFNEAHDGRYGAALTGWVKLGGNTYYMDQDTAVMYTGWRNIDGKRYYFSDGTAGTEGAMAVGWKQIGGVWYLFDGDGSYVRQAQPGETPVEIQPPAGGTGWRYVPETGDYYYFKDYVRKGDYWVGFADGASAWANNWYYADATGKLLTGFQYLDDLKGGKAWYMLQVDNANGEIGKMLSGRLNTYTDAGYGVFSPNYGSQGMCTYTDSWGSYNAATGLWGDGQAHRG